MYEYTNSVDGYNINKNSHKKNNHENIEYNNKTGYNRIYPDVNPVYYESNKKHVRKYTPDHVYNNMINNVVRKPIDTFDVYSKRNNMNINMNINDPLKFNNKKNYNYIKNEMNNKINNSNLSGRDSPFMCNKSNSPALNEDYLNPSLFRNTNKNNNNLSNSEKALASKKKYKLNFLYRNSRNSCKIKDSNKIANNNDYVVDISNVENSTSEFSNNSVKLYYEKNQGYNKEVDFDDCSSINDISNYYNKMKIDDRNYYLNKKNNNNMNYNEQDFERSEMSKRSDKSYKYYINNNNIVYDKHNNYGIKNNPNNNIMDCNAHVHHKTMKVSPNIKNIANENANINRNYIINVNENNNYPIPSKKLHYGYSRSLEDSYILSNFDDEVNNKRHSRSYSANNKDSISRRNFKNQINNYIINPNKNYENNNININYNHMYPKDEKTYKYHRGPIETTDITVYSKYINNNTSPSLPIDNNIYYQDDYSDYDLDYNLRRRREKCIIS